MKETTLGTTRMDKVKRNLRKIGDIFSKECIVYIDIHQGRSNNVVILQEHISSVILVCFQG
jgi:hypothetical protein